MSISFRLFKVQTFDKTQIARRMWLRTSGKIGVFLSRSTTGAIGSRFQGIPVSETLVKIAAMVLAALRAASSYGACKGTVVIATISYHII